MTKYTRNLLHDKPTKRDAFSGGGHQRVANSLAHTVADLDSRDAVIGLDGNWGSGKSSVIEMAEEKLTKIAKGKKFYVMTFDLWANQSLYFRRSFLEQFIRWARDEEGLNHDKEMDDFLEEKEKLIGGREEVVETKTQVHFNLLGAVFVLMLPLLPIIYAWLSPFAIKPSAVPACLPNCTSITKLQHWLVTYGTDISLLMLLLLFIFAFVKYCGLLLESGKPIDSLKQLAGLVERKTEGNIERKLIRDVDPSNTEFSKTFRELLARLQTSDKRIVFVFDNIDRLNSQNSASLAWSDVQAVLLRQSNPDIDQVLTAVVPYDRAVITEALFTPTGNKATQAADPQDLFRKSFDVIHHVPPPVISDVDLFVKERLYEALGRQIDEDSKDRVARVFDLFNGSKNKTPRQVTAFVNELATLWVEWNAEIPFDAIAIFVANRSTIEADRSASTIGDVSRGPFVYRTACTASGLEEYLAMLAYSAPKEMAMQVALYGPIRSSLIIKSSPTLKNELSGSGAFPMMLGRVIDDSARDFATRLDDFENAISNLNTLDTSRDYIVEAISKLADELPHLEAVEDPEDVALYTNVLNLPALLPETDTSTITSALAEWLLRALPSKSEDRAEIHGANWIKAMVQIRDAVIERDGGDLDRWLSIQKKINLPTGPALVYGAAAEADAQNLTLSKFGSRVQHYNLGKFLIDKLENPDELLENAFAQIYVSMSAKQLQPVINKLIAALNMWKESEPTDHETSDALLAVYTLLVQKLGRTNTKIHSVKLIENGAVFEHLKRAHENSATGWSARQFELVILLLDAAQYTMPTSSAQQYQTHAQLGNISPAVTWFIQNVVEAEHTQEDIEEYAAAAFRLKLDFQFVYFAGKTDNNNSFHRQLGSTLLNKKAALLLSGKDFIDSFIALYSLNEKGAFAYGEAKDTEQDSWNDVIPLELNKEIVSKISNEKSQHWPNLLKMVDDALAKRSSEEWILDFANNSTVLETLENRLIYGNLKLPTAQIKKQTLDHLIAIVTADQMPVDALQSILAALTPSSVKSLRKEFLEALGGKSVVGENLLRLHNSTPNLLKDIDYGANPELALSKVLMPLLDVPNAAVGELIQSIAKPLAVVIKKLGDDASQQVTEVLSTMTEVEGFDKVAIGECLGVVTEPLAKPNAGV